MIQNEMEEREKMRREFTANVSHELKTPLTSISGFAEIMRNGLVKEEDISRFSGKIYTESQRLIHLVEDIIKLSQLDDRELAYERQKVDLSQLVDEVVSTLAPEASKPVSYTHLRSKLMEKKKKSSVSYKSGAERKGVEVMPASDIQAINMVTRSERMRQSVSYTHLFMPTCILYGSTSLFAAIRSSRSSPKWRAIL